MAFATIAQMISGQKQFYLYAFTQGTTEWLFSSLKYDLTRVVPGVVGTVWQGSALMHEKFTDSIDSFRSKIPIKFPLTDTFARSFLSGLSYFPTSVRIWKGFLNDPDNELIVQYVGKVVECSPDDKGTITLQCLNDISNLERRGLSAVIQRPCRHSLYGRGCKVVLASYLTAGTVTAISSDGYSITVPAADALDDGFFRGGIFQFGQRNEMIFSHVGAVLKLATKIPGLIVTSPVNLAPGCNLTTDNCLNKFANLDNFGGFPYMDKSPFDGRSVV